VADALDATMVQQNYSRLVIDCNRAPGETSIAEISEHAGVLYNRDPRFAHVIMAPLKRERGLVVGDNGPYSASMTADERNTR
jgi:predicted N-formylglutamate amidohydrolase